MRRRIDPNKVQTSVERRRRHDDNTFSIDAYMDQHFKAVDWKRRREAEKSLVDWVNTYCIGLLLEDGPPKLGEQVLD